MLSVRSSLAACALAAMALTLTPAAQAAPVTFTLTSGTLTQGPGYGSDNAEIFVPRLLGVEITPFFLNPSPFMLAQGQSHSINVAHFLRESRETEISETETDGLGLSWDFSLSPDLEGGPLVRMVGDVLAAPLGSGNYFRANWATRTVSFGQGGLYSLSLSNIRLGREGAFATQQLTVTLLAAPTEPPNPNAVPEPGSLALFGAALAGLAAVRRRARLATNRHAALGRRE